MSVEIVDAEDKHRFEAHIDGHLAGFAQYVRKDGVVDYTHTVVGEQYEGQGVGSALARAALDDARARGLRVIPTCPFIHRWIELHPAYQDLIDEHR